MLEGKSPMLVVYDMPLDTWGECAEVGGVEGKGGPEQCDGSDWRVEVLTNLVSLDVSTCFKLLYAFLPSTLTVNEFIIFFLGRSNSNGSRFI